VAAGSRQQFSCLRLQIVDAGFALTFGATLIVIGYQLAWLLTVPGGSACGCIFAASLCAEIAAAGQLFVFSRVTFAGCSSTSRQFRS
jgi:hypothetical protein